MIKNWNVDRIIGDLQKIYWAGSDPRQDGFTTWGCKQDLYRVQWALEDIMSRMPKYSVEDEWLEQRDRELVWRALNEKSN